MYTDYFQLSKKPFELLPNPEFLYLSKSHKRALTYLKYGLQDRSGFILLTGEVGSGKTTLIRNLLKKKPEEVVLSKIFNTKIDPEQLIAMINDDFGLETTGKKKMDMVRELSDFLIEQFAQSKQPVIIIDEAQNLPGDTLEEIRMLSNLETDDSKLVQIILVGQPELRELLAAPELLQFRQRIQIRCHLHPLTLPETEQYILHRLERAGNREAVKFAPAAFEQIARASRGIPRLINIICDYCMLAAYAGETREISESMVQNIIEELDFENTFWDGKQAKQTSPAENNPTPAQQERSTGLKTILEAIDHKIKSLEDQTDTIMELLLDINQRVEGLDYASTNLLTEIQTELNAMSEKLSGMHDNSLAALLAEMDDADDGTSDSGDADQSRKPPRFFKMLF